MVALSLAQTVLLHQDTYNEIFGDATESGPDSVEEPNRFDILGSLGIVWSFVGFFFGLFAIDLLTLGIPVWMVTIITPIYLIYVITFWYIVIDFIKDIHILGSGI
jgi:hypothetical protein